MCMGRATATRAASGPRTAALTTSKSAQVRDEWPALSVNESQEEALFVPLHTPKLYDTSGR